MKNRTRLFPAA